MGLFTTYKGLEDEQNVKYKNIPFNEDNSFNSQPFIQKTSLGSWGESSVVGSIAQGIDRSVTDGIRLTKFMTTPNGIEFILKQELLSRMSVQTETSGKLNNGVYNPLSTLAQAGVSFAGIHLPSLQDKLSTDLSTPRLGYGPKAYELNQSDQNLLPENRLAYLHFYTIERDFPESTDTLFRYDGGPGSVFGLGATDIKFSTKPDGITPVRVMGPNFIYPEDQLNTPDTYQAVYNHPTITRYERANNKQSLETLYGLNNPGSQRKFDATPGVMTYTTLPTSQSLDVVNGQVIYSSAVTGESKKDIDGATKDLVMFKVGVIDVKTYETNYMHFRSFIDSFSDSYSSDWSSQTYMGRGEKLYKYNSFDRSINMSFTVAAQSRGEMASIYQKLNYLASTVTPQYTDYGYMTGNITKLTVGGYLKDQHGKIDSISFEIPEESPWLVNDVQYQKQPSHDLNTVVNELPFIIKVQMRFTPIHNFRPELATHVLDNRFGDQRYITKEYTPPEVKNTQNNEKDTGGEFLKGGKVTDYEGGGAKATKGPARPTQGVLQSLFSDEIPTPPTPTTPTPPSPTPPPSSPSPISTQKQSSTSKKPILQRLKGFFRNTNNYSAYS